MRFLWALGRLVIFAGLAALVRFSVFLDGQEARHEIGYTGAAQHLYFYVRPGPHRIWSKAENWAEFALTAQADEIVFL